MAAHDVYRYRVNVDRELVALMIDACFPAAPKWVSLHPNVAAYALSGLGRDASRSGKFRLAIPARKCFSYAVDLKRFPGGDFHAEFQRYRDVILLSPSWFLAVPPGHRAALELEVELPRGFAVSAPGEVRRTRAGRWQLSLSKRAWERGGRIAIGRLKALSAARLPRDWRAHALNLGRSEMPRYSRVIDDLVIAMQRTWGAVPVSKLQVLVIGVPRNTETYPWGEVFRESGDAVALYVDGSRPQSQLRRDWVPYHEFSHLVHPYFSPADAWLAEGLASYYQNILRAQRGVLNGDDAWRQIHAGFARGRANTDGATTLANESAQMRSRQRYMRVYWSGAVMALLADVDLRRRSSNRVSLASALGDFARCCLPAARRWSAQAFLAELDARTGYPVWAPLVRRYLDSAEFPDAAPAYAALGLVDNAGKLEFMDTPTTARLRESIMGATPLARHRAEN